ncbi:ShlB/FhaC/HecB family hemolysin secretion/activation protein [Pseudoduganella namucuonensis]|uniref:ShlB/FhaC/HecB family hemolysin secretion/activation protein n=1 Tax=Pseudoduganella namucuonensis TaxID=1035707 RepID=UPI0015A59662|nr:ShlB/FhaC/HecB family hemolysin secretion/activation protein [Pseudoduganella namucuonensis]
MLAGSISLALATAAIPHARAQEGSPEPEQRFDIARFDVAGNTLLAPERVQALLARFTGKQRNFADVQRALEALEGAYRADGYGTVQVELPEQEATSGVVRLNVVEVRIGAVRVTDNTHFGTDNVLRGLPALRTGHAPNLRRLSENVQLSNENGVKLVEVTLAAGEAENTVDAKVRVTDRSPHQAGLSIDNSGTDASGKWRTGVSYQYANLFDRDHTASLAYTTSPDSPDGVTVRNYSVGYRLPLYDWGDSVDFIFGKSSSNTPSSTPTLGGALNIVGKGDVFGLHLNHNFARAGETTSRLVLGLDYKFIDARCSTVDGQPVSIEPPTPPIAACVPYKVTPLSATYSSSTRGGAAQTDYSVGLAVNLPRGARYTNITGRTDRYSYLTSGNRDTRDRFIVLRGGASHLRGFANDWQLRLAASGQYSFQPMVTAENTGLAGAYTVRGFDERALSADSGAVANAELYTYDIGAANGWNASVRGLLFIDASRGWNRAARAPVPAAVSASSAGLGLRASVGRHANLRMDVARVIHAGQREAAAAGAAGGDYRAHVFLTLGY